MNDRVVHDQNTELVLISFDQDRWSPYMTESYSDDEDHPFVPVETVEAAAAAAKRKKTESRYPQIPLLAGSLPIEDPEVLALGVQSLRLYAIYLLYSSGRLELRIQEKETQKLPLAQRDEEGDVILYLSTSYVQDIINDADYWVRYQDPQNPEQEPVDGPFAKIAEQLELIIENTKILYGVTDDDDEAAPAPPQSAAIRPLVFLNSIDMPQRALFDASPAAKELYNSLDDMRKGIQGQLRDKEPSYRTVLNPMWSFAIRSQGLNLQDNPAPDSPGGPTYQQGAEWLDSVAQNIYTQLIDYNTQLEEAKAAGQPEPPYPIGPGYLLQTLEDYRTFETYIASRNREQESRSKVDRKLQTISGLNRVIINSDIMRDEELESGLYSLLKDVDELKKDRDDFLAEHGPRLQELTVQIRQIEGSIAPGEKLGPEANKLKAELTTEANRIKNPLAVLTRLYTGALIVSTLHLYDRGSKEFAPDTAVYRVLKELNSLKVIDDNGHLVSRSSIQGEEATVRLHLELMVINNELEPLIAQARQGQLNRASELRMKELGIQAERLRKGLKGVVLDVAEIFSTMAAVNRKKHGNDPVTNPYLLFRFRPNGDFLFNGHRIGAQASANSKAALNVRSLINKPTQTWNFFDISIPGVTQPKRQKGKQADKRSLFYYISDATNPTSLRQYVYLLESEVGVQELKNRRLNDLDTLSSQLPTIHQAFAVPDITQFTSDSQERLSGCLALLNFIFITGARISAQTVNATTGRATATGARVLRIHHIQNIFEGGATVVKKEGHFNTFDKLVVKYLGKSQTVESGQYQKHALNFQPSGNQGDKPAYLYELEQTSLARLDKYFKQAGVADDYLAYRQAQKDNDRDAIEYYGDRPLFRSRAVHPANRQDFEPRPGSKPIILTPVQYSDVAKVLETKAKGLKAHDFRRLHATAYARHKLEMIEQEYNKALAELPEGVETVNPHTIMNWFDAAMKEIGASLGHFSKADPTGETAIQNYISSTLLQDWLEAHFVPQQLWPTALKRALDEIGLLRSETVNLKTLAPEKPVDSVYNPEYKPAAEEPPPVGPQVPPSTMLPIGQTTPVPRVSQPLQPSQRQQPGGGGGGRGAATKEFSILDDSPSRDRNSGSTTSPRGQPAKAAMVMNEVNSLVSRYGVEMTAGKGFTRFNVDRRLQNLGITIPTEYSAPETKSAEYWTYYVLGHLERQSAAMAPSQGPKGRNLLPSIVYPPLTPEQSKVYALKIGDGVPRNSLLASVVPGGQASDKLGIVVTDADIVVFAHPASRQHGIYTKQSSNITTAVVQDLAAGQLAGAPKSRQSMKLLRAMCKATGYPDPYPDLDDNLSPSPSAVPEVPLEIPVSPVTEPVSPPQPPPTPPVQTVRVPRAAAAPGTAPGIPVSPAAAAPPQSQPQTVQLQPPVIDTTAIRQQIDMLQGKVNLIEETLGIDSNKDIKAIRHQLADGKPLILLYAVVNGQILATDSKTHGSWKPETMISPLPKAVREQLATIFVANGLVPTTDSRLLMSLIDARRRIVALRTSLDQTVAV
jgi:hypothetical protein